jgi:hypothetical protein
VTERVLSERALRVALLARQRLLRRDATGIGVVRAVGGLQTQYAPSGYIGCWTRASARDGSPLVRETYGDALRRRSLVQGTLMRHTIHTVARADYWPFAIAVREARRASWLKATRHAVSHREMAATATDVARVLADGPLVRAAIVDALGLDGTRWNGVNVWLDLVRVPPSGTWERRRADLYDLAERWVGPPPNLGESGAIDHLVKRYLAAFGPASRRDVASYTGLSLGVVDASLTRVAERRFRDVDGGELVDVLRAPLPDEDVEVPVRFLPTWDATLLVHARRTQIVQEPVRPRIFNTKTPQSIATFLVDGQVAGTWALDDGRVRAEAFGRLPRQTQRDVDDEAARLTAFVA